MIGLSRVIHLQHSPHRPFSGITSESKELFLNSLRRDFPRELVPVVLSPLLYPSLDFDLQIDKMTQESTAMTNNMVSLIEVCVCFFSLLRSSASTISIFVFRSTTRYQISSWRWDIISASRWRKVVRT